MTTKVMVSGVEQVVLELGDAGASGCLTVTDSVGEQSEVYFKQGQIYSVYVPGRRAQLGARLIASGDLSPEALTSALDVQANELQGWRLGELLVHLGYVERAVVEAFVVEQLKDAMAELLSWPMAAHKFRKTKKTRQDVAPPMTVRDLLAEVELRRHRWDELMVSIGGERGVPMLSTRPDGAADVVLSSADWALLCKVDGVRDIAELATECGFTVFEAGHVILSLMNAGLVDVELPDDEPVASVTSLDSARGKKPAFEPAPDPANDDLAASVKKVTAALADLFKPVTPPTSPKHEAPAEPARRNRAARDRNRHYPRPHRRRRSRLPRLPWSTRRSRSERAQQPKSASRLRLRNDSRPKSKPGSRTKLGWPKNERLPRPRQRPACRMARRAARRPRGRSLAVSLPMARGRSTSCRGRSLGRARVVVQAESRRAGETARSRAQGHGRPGVEGSQGLAREAASSRRGGSLAGSHDLARRRTCEGRGGSVGRPQGLARGDCGQGTRPSGSRTSRTTKPKRGRTTSIGSRRNVRTAKSRLGTTTPNG